MAQYSIPFDKWHYENIVFTGYTCINVIGIL